MIDERQDYALAYPGERHQMPKDVSIETLLWAADAIEHNRYMQSVSDSEAGQYHDFYRGVDDAVRTLRWYASSTFGDLIREAAKP